MLQASVSLQLSLDPGRDAGPCPLDESLGLQVVAALLVVEGRASAWNAIRVGVAKGKEPWEVQPAWSAPRRGPLARA